MRKLKAGKTYICFLFMNSKGKEYLSCKEYNHNLGLLMYCITNVFCSNQILWIHSQFGIHSSPHIKWCTRFNLTTSKLNSYKKKKKKTMKRIKPMNYQKKKTTLAWTEAQFYNKQRHDQWVLIMLTCGPSGGAWGMNLQSPAPSKHHPW